MQMDDLEFTEFIKASEQRELSQLKIARWVTAKVIQPHYTQVIRPEALMKFPDEELQMDGDDLIEQMSPEEYQQWLNE
jgi:hypothetical protein